MATNKTRLQKLEGSKHRYIAKDTRTFMRIVRPGNTRFTIDGLQVDEATYKTEYADYVKLRKNNGVPNEIIIHVERGEQ